MGSGASSNVGGDLQVAVAAASTEELREKVTKDLSPEQRSKLLEALVGPGGPSHTRKVHIVMFNDVYNLEPLSDEDPVGGAARFATIVKELRQELHPAKLLVLFAGDFVGPSLMSSITQGAHLIDAMNLIGVDYGTFGNHEFDYGYEALINRLHGVDGDTHPGEDSAAWEPAHDYPKSETQWLASNMSEGGTGYPIGGETTKRKALVEVDGVRVGLLAVSENWIPGCSQLKTGELVYEDHIQVAERTAKELRAEGAEVVIALTHNRLKRDIELTSSVAGIDLLLGGHDHFYKRLEKKHRIVKGGQEWRWVTHLVLELNQDGAIGPPIVDVYNADSDVTPDPGMLELIDKYNKVRDKKYCRVLGQSAVELDATEECIRFMEGTLSNWVCDAISEDYSSDEGVQAADFALLVGYSFAGKMKFPAGSFTVGNLMTIFPLPCQVEVLNLTGENVVKSLDLGCRHLPGECGALHHCSHHLAYSVQVNLGKEKNKVHAEDVFVNGKPIELDKIYKVAVSDSMATGKFGYDWMGPGAAERIVDDEDGMQIQDLLKLWLARHAGQPINPSMGRIQFK